MSRPLRIAFGRIAQETNALSPVKTTLEDFQRAHLLEGEALLRACQVDAHEAEGFVKNAELSGFVRAARAATAKGTHVETIPLVSAWAIPSGPLSRETYETLLTRTLDRLKHAGEVDGVMLCLHGAMGVEGVRDPESRIVETLSAATGGRP
ncbi:MAG: M81 family metallopeptidase, partial [Polyangiales bacterium]